MIRGSPLLATATYCSFLKGVQGSGAIRFGEFRALVELEIQPVMDGQLALTTTVEWDDVCSEFFASSNPSSPKGASNDQL